MSICFMAPAGAAVAVDSYCGAIAADDNSKPDVKKTEGGKKPDVDDEEPECE